ncbi:MAG: hypothetical protein WBO06_13850 [Gammaproteobacteria bacterium]
MKQRNRWIMGSAIGLATLAVAIDHTRQRLPEPEPAGTIAEQNGNYQDADIESPCSMNDSPCSMNESPCTLDDSPCTLSQDGTDGDDLL